MTLVRPSRRHLARHVMGLALPAQGLHPRQALAMLFGCACFDLVIVIHTLGVGPPSLSVDLSLLGCCPGVIASNVDNEELHLAVMN
ncbi:hypothetical protein EJB05_53935 [Eragrostis curvula]|uniref:Uncharacterized protein n=1 Tax=Eragrostis curvula TaxID=38414 RepID=A0A5J9SNU1_9POAL|nr:hypothetical protein EJB05_53935 [Eragrostis curvula]